MADDGGSEYILISAEGIVAKHQPVPDPSVLVAPATGAEHNAVFVPPQAVACCSLTDLTFEFDSSFVAPGAQIVLSKLATLRQVCQAQTTGLPPLSVFGHADPTGKDEYNKQLSGRRAQSVYALLTHNLPMWNHLYHSSFGGDDWSKKSIDVTMSGATGLPQDTALATLFDAYMTKLFPNPLGPADFLAQGADHLGKGDYQGCSDFNPLLVLSQGDLQVMSPDTRNERYRDNRRVVIFLFRPGTKVIPRQWPCPRSGEPGTGCHRRFFSNGDTRRASAAVQREHMALQATDDDTFACRFYSRMGGALSPCEQIVPMVDLRLRLIDDRDQPWPDTAYKLEVAGQNYDGQTSGGALQQSIPVLAKSGKLTLVAPSPPDGQDPPPDFWTVDLEIVDDLGASDTIAGAQARLNNLGFFAGDAISEKADQQTTRALQRFQTFYKLPGSDGQPDTSGDLTSTTAAKIKDVYGS